MDCLYYMLLLYSILYIYIIYIVAIRSNGDIVRHRESEKKEEIIDNSTIHYLLCRVITQDCLTFIIYYDYTYCICIIIYNNV